MTLTKALTPTGFPREKRESREREARAKRGAGARAPRAAQRAPEEEPRTPLASATLDNDLDNEVAAREGADTETLAGAADGQIGQIAGDGAGAELEAGEAGDASEASVDGSVDGGAPEAGDQITEEELAQLPPPPVNEAKAAFLATLQRAKEGDRKAFEEIFQMYHRRIYNAVYGMLSDHDDAQDVTQDVFMRLHDALPTLRADEAFSTYLYRIALNLCRDRARRKKRVRFQSMDTPRQTEEGDNEPMEFPDPGRLPEEKLTTEELQRRVRQAVQTLSNDHKAVIVMHHFQGMEVNDIARILGVPTGTVKSRLARGRDQLHRKLRGYLNP